MKRALFSAALICLSLLMGCGPSEVAAPITFTDQKATLKLIACSRGCEQYVLVTDAPESASLSVTNMPDSLKIRAVQAAYVNDQLPVVFSGVRSDDVAQISVADSNDRPKPAFQAYKVRLTAIRRR